MCKHEHTRSEQESHDEKQSAQTKYGKLVITKEKETACGRGALVEGVRI